MQRGMAVTLLLIAAALPLRSEPVCSQCHAAIVRDWAGTLHKRMLQPASPQSVAGDFGQGRVVLHGSTYILQQRDGNYSIVESNLSGKAWEHRVEYTLGGQRIQHYLTTLPDGRIIVLPPAWDIAAKKWIHDVDLGNPEESPDDLVPVWNKSCFSCHVSGGKKNFDAEKLQYHTTWQSAGIDCSGCHGSGAAHAAKPSTAIVNPAKLDPAGSVAICAQCHSLRDVYADGFAAGGNSYDFSLPVMEYRVPSPEDAAFWADGRPRWLSNEAVALEQSGCFLKGGATCTRCHSRAHSADFRPSDASCKGCHPAIAASATAHTHHAPGSSGSSCVECHMPASVISLQSRARDHSMSIPVPENTISHGIPNACNLCHRDKDAAWTSGKMTAWYGAGTRQNLIRRAAAFAAARKADGAAVPALLEILSDTAAGPWMRANAAGYLGGFPDDPAAYGAVLKAFGDSAPLVRATALAAIKPRAAQRETVAPAMVAMLKDPARTVRMNAGIALVAMGVKPFPGQDGARFEEAKRLYQARARLHPDDARQQMAAGEFFYLAGDMDTAATEFRTALKLDGTIPARYGLARSLVAKGDYEGARQVATTVPRDDPQYNSAQQLLAEVEAKRGGSGAQSQFLEGQVQYRAQYYTAALKDLEEALQHSPDAEWADQAKIYRAICLEKLGRVAEAEAAMKSMAAPKDVELQLAYVELLSDTGRMEEARRRIDDLIAAVPNDPLAYFWRARILLDLHHAAEAMTAAEESVRLQGELPQAHNLLIRIYQMLGRSKEAAQQAEWVRDYQRRTQSH